MVRQRGAVGRAGVAWLVEEDARGECMSARNEIKIPSNHPGKVAHATSCLAKRLPTRYVQNVHENAVYSTSEYTS